MAMAKPFGARWKIKSRSRLWRGILRNGPQRLTMFFGRSLDVLLGHYAAIGLLFFLHLTSNRIARWLHRSGSDNEDIFRGLAIFFIAAAIGVCISFVLVRKKYKKLMEPHNFAACTNCTYPLTGLSETGRCPECGRNFSRTRARRLWRSSLLR